MGLNFSSMTINHVFKSVSSRNEKKIMAFSKVVLQLDRHTFECKTNGRIAEVWAPCT